MRKFFALWLLIIIGNSCNQGDRVPVSSAEEESCTVIAEFEDRLLCAEDVLPVPPNTDSLEWLRVQARQWLNRVALVYWAQQTNSVDWRSIRRRLEDLEASLVVASLMDNIEPDPPTEAELRNLYETLGKDWILDIDLFRINIAKGKNTRAIRDSLRRNICLPDFKNLCNSPLISCIVADSFVTEEQMRRLWDGEIVMRVGYPLFRRNRDTIMAFCIVEIRRAGENPPFSYVRDRLYKVALVHKKQEKLKKLYEKAMEYAREQAEFEIYVQ
ncbi:MAG: hypothetical protein GXO48_04670 [Chlorobi bacterium]|nr:hypothetical protein [Chlorobiota bacterium]